MTDILELLREPGAAVTRADVIQEIERLRGDLDDPHWRAVRAKAEVAGWKRTYDHDCGLMKAEIERLRTLLRIRVDELAKKDTEIEQLREALVKDDGGRMAYQNGWDNREPEIERLRGLLRETLEDGYIHVSYGASHEDVSAIRDFEKRVREALGE